MRQFLLALLKYLKLFIGCIHKSEIKTRLPSLEFGKICFQQLISERWESACNHVIISFLLSKIILNPIILPKSDILRTSHDSYPRNHYLHFPTELLQPSKSGKGRKLEEKPSCFVPPGPSLNRKLSTLTLSLA